MNHWKAMNTEITDIIRGNPLFGGSYIAFNLISVDDINFIVQAAASHYT